MDVVRDPKPIGPVPISSTFQHKTFINSVNILPLDMALKEPNLPETEYYTATLHKDDLGLGITVAGYVCEKGIKIFQRTLTITLFYKHFQKKYREYLLKASAMEVQPIYTEKLKSTIVLLR